MNKHSVWGVIRDRRGRAAREQDDNWEILASGLGTTGDASAVQAGF